MNGRPYVDPDLLVVGGLVGFALAIAAAFLPELLALPLLAAALAGAVIMSGVLGRQRGGLHRAVFVGLAPVAGGTLAFLLRGNARVAELPYHVGMGLTTGLLLAFFGYAAGTVEYWAATETPAPSRWDLARLVAVAGGGLAVVVAVRLLAPDPSPYPVHN